MPGGETTGKIWEEAAKGEARNDGVEEAIKEETFGAPQQEEIAEQEALQSEPKDDGADNAEERIEEEKNIVEPHAHSEEEEAPFDGEKKEEEWEINDWFAEKSIAENFNLFLCIIFLLFIRRANCQE